MTNTTMTLKLECLGRELILGPGARADISKVTGLESPEIDIGLSDLAVIDGASHDGTHVKARPIHIEAGFLSSADTEADRERLTRFFNPHAPGLLTATVGSRTRSIAYLLEGWTLREKSNLDANVAFVADLICPDPYFLGAEIVTSVMPGGSAELENDGDQETGWTATITAKDGTVAGPKIKYGDEYIAVQAGISGGDVLVISTEPRNQTVTLNGSSIFVLIDRGSTPFKIPVGGCVVSVEAEQGGQNMACSISYHERFLGV